MISRAWLVLVGALAVPLSLVACSDDGSSDSGSGGASGGRAGAGQGGAGGAAAGQGGGAGKGGGGGAAECSVDADCERADLPPCFEATCAAGECSYAPASDGVAAPGELQVDGDCHRAVCDGHGGIRLETDDDAPASTDACILTYACKSGSAEPAALADASVTCGTGNQGHCQAGACEVTNTSCRDGVKNRSESDIDCGGSKPDNGRLCEGCGYGRTCNTGNDCLSAACHGGRCIDQRCFEPGASLDDPPDHCGLEANLGGAKIYCGLCPSGRACGSAADCNRDCASGAYESLECPKGDGCQPWELLNRCK